MPIRLLYIDLFCGAGGTSTGIENARYKGRQCAKVIGYVNHDANAIASHAANHPDAMHFTEDIRTLELSSLLKAANLRRRAYGFEIKKHFCAEARGKVLTRVQKSLFV